jgi:hypothetical protein
MFNQRVLATEPDNMNDNDNDADFFNMKLENQLFTDQKFGNVQSHDKLKLHSMDQDVPFQANPLQLNRENSIDSPSSNGLYNSGRSHGKKSSFRKSRTIKKNPSMPTCFNPKRSKTLLAQTLFRPAYPLPPMHD